MKLRLLIHSIRLWFIQEWRASQFAFFSGENNFLESHWYRCRSWKKMLSGRTTLQYLDFLVRDIESELSNPRLSERSALIMKDFHKALHNPLVREEIVLFLDKMTFSTEDSVHLWEKIRAAWRTHAISAVPVPARAGLPVPKAAAIEGRSLKSSGEKTMDGFHAKTYVIAAHIYFELAGKEPEYEALSHELILLEKFIQGQFSVQELPGTFSKLKGYSYKRILEGRNMSKKGQLKPCLRQILEHPQVFGEDISRHAHQLFNEHFEG